MAEFTSLTTQEIEAILTEYSIYNITSFEVLSGGSENTNYLVKAGIDKYVLTICEQKSEKKTRELAYLLEHLDIHNFETSKIIRNTNNDPISFWQQKPVILKKFIEGKTLQDLPYHLLELIGRKLGKLHKVSAPEYLPKQVGYGMEHFGKVEKYAANSIFDIWLKKKLEYVTPYFSLKLPKALIHSDVFYDNVIINEDESSIR